MIELIQLDKSIDQDDYGSPVENWLHVAYAWADIDGGRGRSYTKAQNEYSELTHLINIRHCVGLRRDMRVRYYDHAEQRVRYFDILHYQNKSEDNVTHVIYAKERLP